MLSSCIQPTDICGWKLKKMSFWLFLLILHACSAICLRFSTVWPSECHSSAAIHYRLFFVYSRIKWYIMQFIYFETISTARWWNVEKNTVHWEGKSLQVRWAKCDCCWWMNKSVLSAAILFGLTFFRICHTRKYRIFLMNTHKAINVRGILSIVLWIASAVL